MYAWLTPDAIPDRLRCRVLRFPDSSAIEAAINGALLEMCYEANWELYGAVTPAEMSAAMLEVLDRFGKEMCMYPGFVIASAGDSVPDDWLLCDGTVYLVADYADLYAEIGNTYGGAAPATFAVPDYTQRALVGAGGARAIGDAFGAATVALSVAEMPGHAHAEITAVTLPGLVGEIPSPITGVGAGTTGQAGSGAAHENIPPSRAVNWLIKT